MHIGLIFLALLPCITSYNHGFHIQPRPLDWYPRPHQHINRETQRTQRQTDRRNNHQFNSNSFKFQTDFERQNSFEWLSDDNNRSNNMRTNQNKNFDFVWPTDDDFASIESTTQQFAVPGMGTTQSACEDRCLTTREYNPACGDDKTTYYNVARLKCAQKCGKRVLLNHLGMCTTIIE